MTEQNKYELKFDIRSYWRAGSGSQAGAYADLLAIKQEGLPYLPGKQLKGILKKAFTIANDAGWLDDFQLKNDLKKDPIDILFGESGANNQGLIQVSNAQLRATDRQYFKQFTKHSKLLFHTKDTQAIIHETGVTKEGSLRTMEVTVPMVLYAEVGLSKPLKNFKELLTDCCHLINTIGADRNRGLGNVLVSVTKKGEQ